MSSGLALLSTGVGGASELFHDADTGFLFAPDNSYDLFSKIKALVASPDLLHTTSTKARVHAISNLDISSYAIVLEKLFHSHLNNKS